MRFKLQCRLIVSDNSVCGEMEIIKPLLYATTKTR